MLSVVATLLIPYGIPHKKEWITEAIYKVDNLKREDTCIDSALYKFLEKNKRDWLMVINWLCVYSQFNKIYT